MSTKTNNHKKDEKRDGTAKEMLAKVPGMTLKGEDLEVLGKGTPVFYINGRKMQDKDELKRLRSEEIQSVEVITNPGAEYDYSSGQPHA